MDQIITLARRYFAALDHLRAIADGDPDNATQVAAFMQLIERENALRLVVAGPDVCRIAPPKPSLLQMARASLDVQKVVQAAEDKLRKGQWPDQLDDWTPAQLCELATLLDGAITAFESIVKNGAVPADSGLHGQLVDLKAARVRVQRRIDDGR